MIHNGHHCFHCGQVMAAGSQECDNELCRIDERARPTWPWSRCAADEMIALFCAPWWPWLLLPTLGILFLLFGTAIASGRLIDIGLVIVSGWFLSRYLLSLIRNANTTLFINEQSRHQAQARHDAGLPHTNTPELRKKLDDEYDRVEHDLWSVRGCKWLKLTVNLATALLVTLFIMSWGPGDILHLGNIKNWGRDKIEKVADSQIVASAKGELNWDKHRLNYLENMLRRKKGFAYEQFQNIVNHKHFNTESVIEMLKTTKLRGNKLYDDIKIRLDALVPSSPKPEETRGFAQRAQGHFQAAREIYWQIIFWTNLLLSILVTISFILIPISFAIATGIMFADEIKDIVQQKIEEYEQKRREKAGAEPTQPAALTKIKESLSKERAHGIVGISIIALLADFVWEKLLRRFFD